MQELLRSYYDMGSEDPTATEDESFDIDAGGFAPERYVESLLQTKSMEELLRCDDKMVKEVKSLDSDMRELVYENYNKFIAATDTIRKMRGDVASMEQEMEKLTATMDQVGASSGALNTSLASKRDDVDKLVGVRRLLQKLEFLFELPAKLGAAIDEGRYGAAVADFTQVSGILRRYSHVSSFEAIRVESSVAIDGLCVTLMAAVRAALSASVRQQAETAGGGGPGGGGGDPDAAALGALPPETLTEYIGLLHHLGQREQAGCGTAAELQGLFLRYHQARLKAALARAVQLLLEQPQTGAVVVVVPSMAAGDASKGAAGDEAEEGGEEAAAGGDATSSSSPARAATTLSGVVERARASFLLPFAACAARFAELFMQQPPPGGGGEAAEGGEEAEGAGGQQAASEAAAARLMAFAGELLGCYFTAMRASFCSDVQRQRQQQQQRQQRQQRRRRRRRQQQQQQQQQRQRQQRRRRRRRR